jgi:hypothetical protein
MESEKRKSEGVDKTSDQMPKKQRFKDNPELGSLPVELLTKILAQLSTSDLLCNVARVNKQFYQLTKSPPVHLFVTIKANADEEQGAKFLKAALQMRELHITHTENFDGKCHKKLLALANLSNLRFVAIADCILNHIDPTKEDFAAAESCWTTLYNLVLQLSQQRCGLNQTLL